MPIFDFEGFSLSEKFVKKYLPLAFFPKFKELKKVGVPSELYSIKPLSQIFEKSTDF
jgi:hypothetical protein